MAQEDLQWVQDNIEDEFRQEMGWDDEAIQKRLDDADNKYRVAEAYWRKRAQKLFLLVNTSESGSSRGLDALYSRAVAEADRHGKLAEAEETVEETATTGRIGSFEIERV